MTDIIRRSNRRARIAADESARTKREEEEAVAAAKCPAVYVDLTSDDDAGEGSGARI